MLDEFQFHPLAEMFDLLGDDSPAFLSLVEDIGANGLREPITMFGGRVLDGRNRVRACAKAGVKIGVDRQHQFHGDNPTAFVISKNLHRRHLSDDDRALVFARIANLKAGRPMKSGEPENPPIGGITQRQAAESLKISVRSGQRASRVLKTGVPELAPAISTGKVSLAKAAEIAQLPEAKQREHIESGFTRPVIGGEFHRMKENVAKRESPEVSERREEHLVSVMLKARPAERRWMVAHWWKHQATNADKDWLIEKHAGPYQNAKYGFVEPSDEMEEERDRA
jgi:hypothetical protein